MASFTTLEILLVLELMLILHQLLRQRINDLDIGLFFLTGVRAPQPTHLAMTLALFLF